MKLGKAKYEYFERVRKHFALLPTRCEDTDEWIWLESCYKVKKWDGFGEGETPITIAWYFEDYNEAKKFSDKLINS